MIVGRQSGIPTSHQRLTRYLEVTGSRSSAGWKTWPDYPDSIHVIVIIVTNLENLLRRHPSITGLVETNHTWLVYLPMSCGLARRIKNRLALACECCFGTTVLVPWVKMILALSMVRHQTQSGSWVDRCKSLICSWHSASFAVLETGAALRHPGATSFPAFHPSLIDGTQQITSPSSWTFCLHERVLLQYSQRHRDSIAWMYSFRSDNH